jgi:hypothetical protein
MDIDHFRSVPNNGHSWHRSVLRFCATSGLMLRNKQYSLAVVLLRSSFHDENVPFAGRALHGLIPRSAKRRPEPGTRSFTVETDISPASTSDATLSPMMNRDAAHLGAHHFAFSGVRAGVDFKAERLDRMRDGARPNSKLAGVGRLNLAKFSGQRAFSLLGRGA